MKNNKRNYAVNKQEDEDVEACILYPENAANSKQNHLQKPVINTDKQIKQNKFITQKKIKPFSLTIPS